jgi:flagellar motor protein MotB
MDALLAKIESAPTGVKLLMVLAEAQDVFTSETGPALARREGSKMELIACVTAWRDAHDGPEWTQVTAMVFGEVLKAFDAAALVAAAEAAAAEAVAAEAAAAAAAAAEAAEAAAAPIIAAKLADATALIEELVKTTTEQTDRISELEAQMEAQGAERKKETNELKEQVRGREEQLRELRETHAASMEAARQGLKQQEAAHLAVVRRRESDEADAAAAAALAAEYKEEDAAAAAAKVAAGPPPYAAAVAVEEKEPIGGGGAQRPELLEVGDRCKVYYEKYSQWYSGTVEEVQVNDEQYMVHFDDGDRTTHAFKMCQPCLDIVPASGSWAQEAMVASMVAGGGSIGDRCKVFYTKYERWYPGTIDGVKVDDEQYVVHFDDGEQTSHKYTRCRPCLGVLPQVRQNYVEVQAH